MTLSFKPDFNQKVVVVTGGAGILGRYFCKALAECGAKVAILDLNENQAKSLAADLRQQGLQAIGIACNVLEKETIIQAKKEVNQTFGKVDILINGAGGNSKLATTDDSFFDEASLKDDAKKSFFDLDLKGFNFVFGLSFTGTLLPIQVF